MQKTTVELNDDGETSDVAPAGLLENIAYILLLSLPFFLTLFFIPSTVFPFQFSKMFLLSMFVLVSFACWIVARLKDGKFVFPATVITLASVATFIATALSGIFSGSLKWSFIGQSVDIGTISSMAILFLLIFLVPIVFRSKDRIFYSYLVFFAAFFIIAIFHILRLIFGVGFLQMGIFTDVTSNMIGKWNDLGIFFGIGTVLSLITLELISLSRVFKILSYLALIVSLFFLMIVNFAPVWYVLATFSLIFLVYIISFDRSDKRDVSLSVDVPAGESSTFRKIPVTSLLVLIISLVFILGGNFISGIVSNKFGISQVEARPSWVATFAIAKDVLARDPVFGAGPNRFAEKWVLYKPDGINSTVFWNTDFNFGVGLIPTFFVTTGILGALSWLIFLGTFLFVGFRAILSSIGDKVSRYLVSSSFLVSLYLWIVNVFYIPSPSLLAFTFFFTGLFIASLYQNDIVKPVNISFTEDPKRGFVSVLCLILLLIGTVALGYTFTEKFIASVYFQKGIISFSRESNLDKAENYLIKATNLDSSSVYYRGLVQVDMLRMSGLLSQNTANVSADAVRTQFRGFLSAALSHAEKAISIDKTDYQNWVSLGQVYEAVVPLKIADAYTSALNAYKQALTLNPKSPALLLTMARLEMSSGNNVRAKDYISQALKQKNNYTEAIFLLAQIQVSEGNTKDAISSVEAASYLSPNDSGILFQLGLLRYNNKDFQGAGSALEQAVVINPSYANAKYFLGLSLYRLGRVADAIKLFNDLKTTNPDNKEIDLILSNIKAGRDPFANATLPMDSKPEKRSKPPVSESASAKSKSSATTKTGSDNPDSVDESL